MKYNSLWTGSVSINSPVSLEGNTSYHVVNWNCRRIRCRLLETSLYTRWRLSNVTIMHAVLPNDAAPKQYDTKSHVDDA
jgi:hypothetical protein